MQPVIGNPTSQPTKILVRGVNWLGDAVMSTPALLRLREALPEAHIAILTATKLESLWEHHPAVDSVLTINPEEGVWSVAGRLRRESFEAAVILPNSFRSALEPWLARIPQRIGYRGQWRRGLLTRPVDARPGAGEMRKRSEHEIRRLVQANTGPMECGISESSHHVHQYLHLMGCLGANPAPLPPQIRVTETEVQTFLERWSATKSPAQPLFGLNPGAEYGPAKRWPAERFVAAAIEIHQRTNCQWAIFGGPADRELAEGIASQIREALQRQSPMANAQSPFPAALNLAGQTTLRELAAGLKACRVLLTNDTGPMHLAAALGTPVVALFGSTSPTLTGPGLPGDSRHCLLQTQVPCSPCFLRQCPIDFRCMRGISVEHVVEAVLRIQQERMDQTDC